MSLITLHLIFKDSKVESHTCFVFVLFGHPLSALEQPSQLVIHRFHIENIYLLRSHIEEGELR